MFMVTRQWMSRYTKDKTADATQCMHSIRGVRCRIMIRVGEHAARPSPSTKYFGRVNWPKCYTCSLMLGITG